MAVEFLDVDDYIQFTSLNIPAPTSAFTFSAWYYANSYGFYVPTSGQFMGRILTAYNSSTMSGGYIVFFYSVTGLALQYSFSSFVGSWYKSSPPFNTWTHLLLTYNPSSTANDPTFYINGTSVSITELATPSGTAFTNTIDTISIGESMDGKLKDIRIYNRIVTASEISALSSSSNINKHIVQDGLLFWMPCVGTAGTTTFDGMVLSTGNPMIDIISEAGGIPYGSPKGVDTISLWEGHSADALSSFVPTVSQKIYLRDSGMFTTSQIQVGSDTDAPTIDHEYIQFPRLTTAERNAISSPANGMVIWNSTTNQLEVYNGGWVAV